MGAILGIFLGLAAKFLNVKQDERLAAINAMLPGYNCGACGLAGCLGFAEAILSGDTDLTECKPLKKQTREQIQEFLLENSE